MNRIFLKCFQCSFVKCLSRGESMSVLLQIRLPRAQKTLHDAQDMHSFDTQAAWSCEAILFINDFGLKRDSIEF